MIKSLASVSPHPLEGQQPMGSRGDRSLRMKAGKEKHSLWWQVGVVFATASSLLALSVLYLDSWPWPPQKQSLRDSKWTESVRSRRSNIFSSSISLGPVELDISQQPFQLKMSNAKNETYFKAEIGRKFKSSVFYEEMRVENGRRVVKVEGGSAALTVEHYTMKGADCVDVSWKAVACVTEVLSDCVDLPGAHWYGGSELSLQEWPLEKVSLPLGPYLAQEMLGNHRYGAVQERMFFNSEGVGIYIEEEIPLFVSINESNDKKLCLEAKYDNMWYFSFNNRLPELNYTICKATDVRSIHQFMSDRFIKKPIGIPNLDIFRYPIWSTWAKYGKRITQKLVVEFVDDILDNGFPIAQIEIDDSWTEHYGDLEFDRERFPDPKSLVDSMHSRDVAVTLWVHPFVNVDSKRFSFLAGKGWLMMNRKGSGPALTSWWDGKAAGYYDFGNRDAVAYFLFLLDILKQAYGIDSFKFDAGDVTFLPPFFKGKQQFLNVNNYARLYAEAAYMADSNHSRLEVRVGARSQDLPVMVRMLDRASDWSLKTGLKSVITSGLVFGILGYPFVLPDYIGGNNYHHHGNDSELFIRWMQANALMPFMQLSVEPWKHNDTLLNITKDMMELHFRYANKMIALARDSMTTGYPIMRPLWWIAPTDEAALTVNDQFLIGNDLLVAPVLDPGQTVRKIYLPPGWWLDELKHEYIVGEQWIDYPVLLHDLPHFTKVG